MGRKKEIADEELLAISRRCFLAHGQSLSTAKIAKVAGVSQATLFNRFSTKRELMIQALRPPISENLKELFESLPDQRPVKTQMIDIGLQLYQMFQETYPGIQVLKSAGVSLQETFSTYDIPPPVRGMMVISAWLQALKKQKRIDLQSKEEMFRDTFFGTIRHLAIDDFMFEKRKDKASIYKYMEELTDFLWEGLKPKDD